MEFNELSKKDAQVPDYHDELSDPERERENRERERKERERENIERE